MKKDWTYKKLGEFISEYSVKNKTQEDIPVYSVTNDQGFCQGYFDKDVSSKDKSNYKIVPYGFFAYNPSRINVGSIACQTCEERVIVSPLYNVFKVSENISQPYLLYYLKSPVANVFINAYARGAVRNNFSLKKMGDMFIPIPPLSIQRSIVAELDLLHSVISKKKEQLRELDNLAQSLFYQMFGDPITNPMGWEIKKLGEVAENCDYMRKPITASDRIPGNIPYYGASGIVDYVRDYIFDGDYLLVSEDGANLLARSTPIAFSISGKNWVNNHAHVLKFRESYTQLYVQTLINLIDISDIVTGAVQPKLNQAQLNKFPLPLPPLSLQQSFAAKVSAIEAQKQAITQSIQHTEALLAQRMDNYFG